MSEVLERIPAPRSVPVEGEDEFDRFTSEYFGDASDSGDDEGFDTDDDEDEGAEQSEQEDPTDEDEDEDEDGAGNEGDDEAIHAVAPDPAADIGPPLADLERIARLVDEQRRHAVSDAKVFDGVKYLDDIARIVNPDDRERKLNEISEMLEALATRRNDLRAALRPYPANRENIANRTIADGYLCISKMTEGFPDDFQRMDGDMARQRIETMLASKEDKAAIRAELMQGFRGGDGADISRTLGVTFKNVVEPVSTKSFERQSFYFDQFVTAPPPDQMAAIAGVTDTIVRQAQRLLDAGGRLKDVEALMAKTGIPKEWWPPQFIDTLQAWRKTERAMMEERVSDSFAKKKFDITSLKGMVEFTCDTVPEAVEGSTAVLRAVMDLPPVVEAIASLLSLLKTGYNLGDAAASALKDMNFDSLPAATKKALMESLDQSLDVVKAALDGAVAGLKLADTLGATAVASAMGTVVPGLAIAACGVNMAIAAKELAKHGIKRGQTEMLKGGALKALGNASMEDGGAFLKTLDNECNQRNKKLIESGIELGVATAEMGGAIAGTAGGHYGVAAQAGIKVLTTGVQVGTKLVFTGINWGEANRAKALLKEAQAGNPNARMEIFKNSALYAKMYICVLCKEGNPLAKKFVLQRGIEEDDLDEATSLKIMREAMLESADQKDENDISDSLLGAYTPEIVIASGKLAARVVKKGAALAKAGYDKATGNNKPYDPTWAFNIAANDIPLNQAHWDTVKAQARQAGLYDEATGIGKALGRVESALGPARAEIAQYNGEIPPDAVDTHKKKILAAIAALNAAYTTVYKYTPISTPTGEASKPELHRGMSIYLGLLNEKIGTERTDLEDYMRNFGLKNVTWQPGVPSDPLDTEAWSVNWKAGVKTACLPGDDSGMLKAMKAAISARETYDAAVDKDKSNVRRLAFEYSGALNDLISVSNKCLRTVQDVPLMAGYVERIRGQAAEQRRDLDKIIAAVDWHPIIPNGEAIDVAAWNAVWDEAVANHYVRKSAGDGGVADAIKGMKEAQAVVESAKDGKDKLKARRNFAKAAGKMLKAKIKFAKAQPDVSAELVKFVERAYAYTFELQNGFNSERSEVTFQPAPGLSKGAWQATYRAAIAAGAVPAAKSGAEALAKALAAFTSGRTKLVDAVTAKDFDDARKLAETLTGRVAAVIDAIDTVDAKLMGPDRYENNNAMDRYLKGLRAAIKSELDSPIVQVTREGNLETTGSPVRFQPAPFSFDQPNFTDVKNDAITLGVIPKRDTGMRKVIQAQLKSVDALTKALKSADAKKIGAAKDNALKKTEELRAKAEELKDPAVSRNAGWLAYVDSIIAAADQCSMDLARQ